MLIKFFELQVEEGQKRALNEDKKKRDNLCAMEVSYQNLMGVISEEKIVIFGWIFLNSK